MLYSTVKHRHRHFNHQSFYTLHTHTYTHTHTHTHTYSELQKVISATLKIPRYYTQGARGGVVVKALRYKPAGCGFDSRWCH